MKKTLAERPRRYRDYIKEHKLNAAKARDSALSNLLKRKSASPKDAHSSPSEDMSEEASNADAKVDEVRQNQAAFRPATESQYERMRALMQKNKVVVFPNAVVRPWNDLPAVAILESDFNSCRLRKQAGHSNRIK